MTIQRPSAFPPTRLSVIERIRARDVEVRREAFGDLASCYWRPVYTHLRLRWHLAPEDAADVTQGFFAGAFEKNWLEGYDPERARFRTFVRVCVDRFVMNWKQAATRAKRGGAAGAAQLDFDAAERGIQDRSSAGSRDPDEVFHEEFIRSVFARAVEAVRDRCEARGHDIDFRLFERYNLDPDVGISYAALAEEFGIPVTQVTNRLARIRRTFRREALDALRILSGSDEHYRAEAREVFGLEVE